MLSRPACPSSMTRVIESYELWAKQAMNPDLLDLLITK